MYKTCLICIDMQNDFLYGSLANKSAQDIVPIIADEIEYGEYDGLIFTQDTHTKNYLNTPEGKNLPVEHCIRDTHGWMIDDVLSDSMCANFCGENVSYLEKPTFGTLGLLSAIESLGDFDEVVLCGTCTDICVVSNAIILKTMKPNLKITVLGYACAGLTPEKHEAALSVMESCQINVIRNK